MNEKEARRHLIDKPNILIRIHPDGQVLYSVRLSLVLSCPMSLEYYPLDHQKCLIDLASYAYTTEDIKYLWKETDPVQQKAGLKQSLPSFDLQEINTGYCTSKTNTVNATIYLIYINSLLGRVFMFTCRIVNQTRIQFLLVAVIYPVVHVGRSFLDKFLAGQGQVGVYVDSFNFF
uniref:Neur_chan_LBD domain-containing protein n=1 Tax=Rhabditophanes sp. KR3021 TaxID=114890 RepID=A0AC35TS36_9BILA